MPVVRSVLPGEVDRAGEIGSIAFQGDKEGWQGAFREHVERHGTDALLVVEHEGVLVSSMLIVLEGMRMGHAEIPSGAVAGVGTVPEARRMGCAAAMLHETVRRLRAWGVAASPMWPFSFAYYRKFGWEIGGETRVVTWKRDTAWQIPPSGEVVALTVNDGDALAAVWDAVGPLNRCSTVRTPDHWRRYLRQNKEEPQRFGLLCRQDGRPAGYVLANVTEAKDGETPPVEITEIRALNAGAEVALLNAVTARVERETFRAGFPPHHRLRSVAVDPRALETQLNPSFGFRVIDPAAIASLFRAEHRAEPVTLRIEDALQGNRTLRLPLDGGPSEDTGAEADLWCSIHTFSQIASGYLKPRAAMAAGLLHGDAGGAARLDDATAGWSAPFRSGVEAG